MTDWPKIIALFACLLTFAGCLRLELAPLQLPCTAQSECEENQVCVLLSGPDMGPDLGQMPIQEAQDMGDMAPVVPPEDRRCLTRGFAPCGTFSCQPGVCGEQMDLCGDSIMCGCDEDLVCINERCVPPPMCLPNECGEITDEMRGTLDCGMCEGDLFCKDNACVERPACPDLWCEDTEIDGIPVSCGACEAPRMCVGNRCQCPGIDAEAECMDIACGSIFVTSECGGERGERSEVNCDAVKGGCGTDEVCSQNMCECPTPRCDQGGTTRTCGMVTNACGNTRSCGSCVAGQSCLDDACATVTALAVGQAYNCVVTNAGQVLCWGDGSDGKLGTGSTADVNTATRVEGIDDAASVHLGKHHACVRTRAGGVTCWGRGTEGQLGTGANSTSSPPTPVVGLDSGVTRVVLGDAHTCALRSGKALCWGSGSAGQIGQGMGSASNTPQEVSLLVDLRELFASGDLTCGQTINNSLFCWGDPDGAGAMPAWTMPTVLTELGQTVNKVSLSAPELNCVRRSDSSVWCFGGAVGTLTAQAGTNRVTEIVTGQRHHCAMGSSSGSGVWCWGENDAGQLGIDPMSGMASPTEAGEQVFNDTVLARTRLALGLRHTCALDATGTSRTMYCWGDNTSGQLGIGEVLPQQTHVPQRTDTIPGGVNDTFIALGAGDNHTCVLRNSGSIYCWGANASGQLGDGSNSPSAEPVQVLVP